MKNPVLKYSLLGSLLLILFTIAGYSLDWYKFLGGWWTFIDVSIMFGAIYLGVKEIRQKKYAGEIKYQHALFEGLKIVVIIAALHSACIYFYFTYDQKKFNEYKSYTVASVLTAIEEARKQKKFEYTDKDIQKFKEMVNTDFFPVNLAKQNAVNTLLFGLIFSLIIAMILRKKNPQAPVTLDGQLK